ncbi:MFS transporter [Phenylobacterium sp. 58.2.17]|uniref:MFS transporter n=1 Tax=Phenylobacterium sp. 58.2.17 TaxID=2969306 RepID=UPI0022651DF4|nr:MFS transporter [Phenylobacterium sp. 58.2.17]MCX7587883.1 MFS transporter [Phenylobacterium sp. 58.2.17]
MLDAHPADGAAAAVHDTAPPERPAWSGVAALSLSVFGLVTAEFLPPSVLTPLASDLGVSLGAAGQAVTATAVVGAFAALLVPVVTSRWDRRLVLLGLLLLLGVSNLMTATAVNLPMLLAARVVLGVSLGGFWSMAAATTMRLVPMPVLPRAMSIVFTGVTVATVSAAPVGAYVGDLLGWRATFLIAGLVGVAALACLWLTLPRLKPGATAGLKDLAEVAVRPRAMVVLASVVVVISGHFAGFTYIRPVLEQVVRLDVAAISLVLLAFGCAGFIGNFVGAFLAERDPKLAIITGSGLMSAAMTALVALGATPWLAAVALTVWGLAFAMLPVGFQAWMVADVPDRPELAGGLLTAAFQVAIASGAVAGGLLVDRFGVLSASVYCGAAAAVGACLVLALRRRRIAHAAACAA